MSAPRLSEKTKQEILAAYRAGEKIKDIAARFGVSESYPSLLSRRRLKLQPFASKGERRRRA